MKNKYNLIAPLYDLIAKVIFGNHLIDAQFMHLNSLPEEGRILFIGGGSGKTLKKLVLIRPNLIIDYVDASKKMIDLSKKKLKEINYQINFIVGNENSIPHKEYDAILTFFFLDLFKEHRRNQVFKILYSKLKFEGLWLIADFNIPSNSFHRMIEFSMFLFLRVFTNIGVMKIEDYHSLFEKRRFELSKKSSHFSDLIFSTLYSKRVE